MQDLGQSQEMDVMDPTDEDDGDAEMTLEEKREQDVIEGMALATVFLVFATVALTVWLAFVWPPLPVEHGYPSVSVSPGAPGAFLSQRWSFMYVCAYALIINYAPCAFLAIAIATPGRITGIFLHRALSVLAAIINFVAIWGLLFSNWWYNQSDRAVWNALANPVDWCCAHAHATNVTLELCGHISSMCVPLRDQQDMHTNVQYVFLILGAVAFFGTSVGHLGINWVSLLHPPAPSRRCVSSFF